MQLESFANERAVLEKEADLSVRILLLTFRPLPARHCHAMARRLVRKSPTVQKLEWV